MEAISELHQGFEKEVQYLVFDEIGNLELKKKQGTQITSWHVLLFLQFMEKCVFEVFGEF